MAWVFLATEIIIQGMLTTGFYMISLTGSQVPIIVHQAFQVLAWKGRKRPMLRLMGQNVPTVNVIITCCGYVYGVLLLLIGSAS